MAENNCKCVICGKEFHVPPSILRDGFGMTCSRMCRDAYKVGRPRKLMPKLKRKDLADAYYAIAHGDKSVNQASKELGISQTTLMKWYRKFVYEGEVPPDKYFED